MTNYPAADVLVVDANSVDAELTLRAIAFGNAALRVVSLPSGRAALRYLSLRARFIRLRAELPKLVLLDHDLPHLSGASVLERMKMQPQLARIPVVMLSSTDDPKLTQRFLDLGANEVVVKAVGPDEYASRIRGSVCTWVQT